MTENTQDAINWKSRYKTENMYVIKTEKLCV